MDPIAAPTRVFSDDRLILSSARIMRAASAALTASVRERLRLKGRTK
jgi:hypothetical protein